MEKLSDADHLIPKAKLIVSDKGEEGYVQILTDDGTNVIVDVAIEQEMTGPEKHLPQKKDRRFDDKTKSDAIPDYLVPDAGQQGYTLIKFKHKKFESTAIPAINLIKWNWPEALTPKKSEDSDTPQSFRLAS